MKRWKVRYHLKMQLRQPDKRLAADIGGRRRILTRQLAKRQGTRTVYGKFRTECGRDVWVNYDDIYLVDFRAEAVDLGILSDDPEADNYHGNYRASTVIFGRIRWIHRETNRSIRHPRESEIKT